MKEADYNQLLNQLIFYGVRVVNTQPSRENFTREQAERDFKYAQLIVSSIGCLTPVEFVQLFPIEKTYDGDRWETKDYFYTRDYMNTLDQEKPIGENATNLLWEYMNWDIRMFTVNIMSYMDNLRRLDGQVSVMEEWADMNGIGVATLHTDQKGNEFLLDKTGKTIKVEKPKPRRRLKLVK